MPLCIYVDSISRGISKLDMERDFVVGNPVLPDAYIGVPVVIAISVAETAFPSAIPTSLFHQRGRYGINPPLLDQLAHEGFDKLLGAVVAANGGAVDIQGVVVDHLR